MLLSCRRPKVGSSYAVTPLCSLLRKQERHCLYHHYGSPDSYKGLELLDSSMDMDLWITPEKLELKVSQGLPEDYLVVRSIYQTFALLVLDPIEGTPTILQVSIREASEKTEVQ